VASRFAIEDIQYVLGEKSVPIRSTFPDYSKVIEKTGIEVVHESSKSALDLAHEALEKLLDTNPGLSKLIGCIIYVSQSPVNFLPSGACLLQSRSSIGNSIIAFDMGQGCSGFVQALSLASKMVSEFCNIVIVCADTYRAKIEKGDRSTSVVFSDAASATWISNRPKLSVLSETHFTDGSGGKFLRQAVPAAGQISYIKMSGADVLLFTRRVVPQEIDNALHKAMLNPEDIDYCFLHQASKLVLDGLIERFPRFKKIPVNLENIGNTVSSSIPILISEHKNVINESRSVLSGFGVGLSTATIVLG
jgi:3-oxoacyl-[acyl-carrier-protein] synthase III